MEEIVIVGYGGHAQNVIETIDRCGSYKIIGYTDLIEYPGNSGYPYLGTDDALEEIYKTGCHNAFCAVGQVGTDVIRHKIYSRLKKIGFNLPAIIDRTSLVAEDVSIGEGSYVGKFSLVNAGSIIGKMCIVNNGALIEHGCTIGDHCHVAVHATLCGEVEVGSNSFIGASATVIQGVSIGEACIIGAGSLIRHSVESGQKVYGSR